MSVSFINVSTGIYLVHTVFLIFHQPTSVLCCFIHLKVSSVSAFIHLASLGRYPLVDHNIFNCHKLKWFWTLHSSQRKMTSTLPKSGQINLSEKTRKFLAETSHESMKSKIFVYVCECVSVITELTSMNRLISLRAQHVSERAGVVAAAFKARVYLLFSNLWLILKKRCPRLDHLYSLFVIRPTVTSSLLHGW